MNLSVVILTHDEEVNLAHCLESLRGLQASIIVVDSGSRDRTVEIARKFGAVVLTHSFETHARQWRWALDSLPANSEWVLGLDADQRVSSELRSELAKLFGAEMQADGDGLADETVDGYYVNRRQIFRGKWLRHGGYYPKYLLKLFRREKVFIDPEELLDHHFYVPGPVAKLRGEIVEENRKEHDISFWIEKHIRYASLVAREEIQSRTARRPKAISASLFGNPDERSLWLKGVWRRLPLYLRPFLYFFYRYVFRLGFLDGKQGFVFHVLQGFWFRLLVDIKLDEMRRADRVSKLSGDAVLIVPHKRSENGH